MTLKRLTLSTAIFLGIVTSSSAQAADARSIALGGLAITNGQGVHGVAANPATLMHLHRRGRNTHLLLGTTGDFRDPGKFIETAIDNAGLANDISVNIDELSSRPLQCGTVEILTNTVCLEGTEELGNNFQSVIDILNVIDDQPMELIAEAQSGIARTKSKTPIAVYFSYSLAASGVIGVSEKDTAYLGVLRDSLIDGQLTGEDINNSIVSGVQIVTVDPNLEGAEVVRPENFLTSQYGGTRLDRRQVGISVARTFLIGEHSVDFGVTPKVSSVTSYRAAGGVAPEFDADSPSIVDNFNNAESNTTTFTMDLGATYVASDKLTVSSVVRNLFAESVSSEFDSFEFKTTPQFLVGLAYRLGAFTFNTDLALNSALKDNIQTQPFSIGAELGSERLSLRAGFSVDNGRRLDKTAATLGIGLGPLQIGARLSSLNAIQAGAQLSFSF